MIKIFSSEFQSVIPHAANAEILSQSFPIFLPLHAVSVSTFVSLASISSFFSIPALDPEAPIITWLPRSMAFITRPAPNTEFSESL